MSNLIYLSSDEDEPEVECVGEQEVDIENEKKKSEEREKVKITHRLTIEGVKVEMPVKPYDCQEAVIASVSCLCNFDRLVIAFMTRFFFMGCGEVVFFIKCL